MARTELPSTTSTATSLTTTCLASICKLRETWLSRWWFQTFFFSPQFGEDEPILTVAYFFRWIGSTTNQLWRISALNFRFFNRGPRFQNKEASRQADKLNVWNPCWTQKLNFFYKVGTRNYIVIHGVVGPLKWPKMNGFISPSSIWTFMAAQDGWIVFFSVGWDVELRITTTSVPLADRNGTCHRGRFEVFLVMSKLSWSSKIWKYISKKVKHSIW